MRVNILQFLYGVADYILGALLLVAPWLFGFTDHMPATAVTVGFGAVIIAYSALTDYQLAAVRQVPLPVHLGLDALAGGLLIGAPFLFGFADRTWLPHLVIGIVTASIALVATLGYTIRHMPRRPAHQPAAHRRVRQS